MRQQGTVVRWEARPPRRKSTRAAATAGLGAWVALPLMAAYAGLLLFLAWTKQAPWWVLPVSLLLNLAAFFAYWQDKHAAETGQWRISENTRHLWSLAGGWGGAWVAQQVLRHKSRKASFLGVYWLSVVAHCAAVGYWAFGPAVR